MHKKKLLTLLLRKVLPIAYYDGQGMCCSFRANVARKISMDLDTTAPLILIFENDLVLSAAPVVAIREKKQIAKPAKSFFFSSIFNQYYKLLITNGKTMA